MRESQVNCPYVRKVWNPSFKQVPGSTRIGGIKKNVASLESNNSNLDRSKSSESNKFLLANPRLLSNNPRLIFI